MDLFSCPVCHAIDPETFESCQPTQCVSSGPPLSGCDALLICLTELPCETCIPLYEADYAECAAAFSFCDG